MELDSQGNLVVARVLAGGSIERQGILKPGDTILEVNGSPVSTPEELRAEVAIANDSLTLRVVPTNEQIKPTKPPQVT